MPKLFSRFILSPKDAGMQKYSVEEIAEMMKPRDNADEQTLMEFACVVSEIFEDSPCSEKEDLRTGKWAGPIEEPSDE